MVKYKGISRELIDTISVLMAEIEELAVLTGLRVFLRKRGVKKALNKYLKEDVEPLITQMFKDSIVKSNKLYRQEVTALQDFTKVKFKYDREVLDGVTEKSLYNMRDPQYQKLYTRREIYNLRSAILKGKYSGYTEQEMVKTIRDTVKVSKNRALMVARFETQHLEEAAIDNALKSKQVDDNFIKKYNIKDSEARVSHIYSAGYDAGNGSGFADNDGNFTAKDGTKFSAPPNPVSPWNCRCYLSLVKRPKD